jgi:flagellar hook-associated protein FlgK
VDEDEEAQNLIELQNLLNYQYQVISVMNEVLDRLINSTGV